MTVRRIAVSLAASAALALSGCAGNSAGSSPGAPTSAPPPSSAAPSAGETLSGTVAAGVEPNCLILQGGGTHHVLLFDDPSLRAAAKVGSSITVTGRAEPAQMTTCQQGVPFIVTAIRAN